MIHERRRALHFYFLRELNDSVFLLFIVQYLSLTTPSSYYSLCNISATSKLRDSRHTYYR